MDKIIEKYKSSRFEECLYVLKKELQKEDSLVENCIKQNCIEVCQCMVIISQNNSSEIVDTLRNLYKSYQCIIATGLPGVLLPVQLELTCLFNFVWWNLFYINFEGSEIIDRRVYLPVIQRGLRRVLGISCKINNSISIIEDILCDIGQAGRNIQTKDYSTVCLLVEIIVLALLYILKTDCSENVLVQCLETVTTFIEDIEKVVIGLKAVREFQDPCPLYKKLFKFGFVKINSTVSDISTNAISCIYIIKALCFFLLKKYKNVLFIMKNNLKGAVEQSWCYIRGLSAFMMQEYDQCLGFVVMSEDLTLDGRFKSRFSILHGQLLSRKEDYKKALNCFIEATRISPGLAAACYYMGEEYGKIGLTDDMVDCFKNAIKVKQEYRFENISPFTTSFESVILDILHPADEILESEVTYAATVALGLIEKYQESAEMFEKYMEIRYLEREGVQVGERIIKTPSVVTILHEAAAMNILAGNLSRAEYMLSQSSNHYSKSEDSMEVPRKDVHVTKDVNWLQNLLHEELGLNGEVGMEKNDSIDLFTEEMVYFFEEDVIALMLSAEMNSKSDEVSYKTTLGKLISIFSKYLARLQKRESITGEEKLRSTLVKALSARTCLNIANYQMKRNISGAEIERTFKRALSCNPGDKDTLFWYCKFLLGDRRKDDAEKLWRTFHEKVPVLVVDQCQSLALRYLLRTQVSRKDWEKIEMDLHLSAMDVDFDL